MKIQLIVEFEAIDEADAARIESAVRVLTKQMSGISVTVRRNDRVK